MEPIETLTSEDDSVLREITWPRLVTYLHVRRYTMKVVAHWEVLMELM
jgi:hypothetical protein